MIMHSLGTEAAAGSVIKIFLKNPQSQPWKLPHLIFLTPITSSIINMAFLRDCGGYAISEPRAEPSNCSKTKQ